MRLLSITVLSLAILAACSKSSETAAVATPGNEQVASVKLKDGSSFSGTVKSSDSTAITLVGPGGETRTYPMAQVAAVNYDSPGAAIADKPSPSSAPIPAAAPVAAPSAPASTMPAARMEERLTVPAGITVEVRNNEAIDSKTAHPNQVFSAVVTQDIQDDQGRVAVPRGSNANLVVRAVEAQGKVQGQSELVLDIASVRVGGRTYRIETSDLVEKGKEGVGANKRTAAYTGGVAALGGIIGAIAGGGKGAAIGAVSGAGAGAGAQTLTRGKSVRVPAETILRFTLEQPIQIRLVH
jgi:hypothetical protein